VKKLALLVAFAAVLSSTAHANNLSVSSSTGGRCSNQFTSGKTLEFGTTINSNQPTGFYQPSSNASGSVYAKVVIALDKPRDMALDCNVMYRNETRRQEIELERMELELALLRKKLANDEPVKTTAATGDDW
jgi:hypothetical protein